MLSWKNIWYKIQNLLDQKMPKMSKIVEEKVNEMLKSKMFWKKSPNMLGRNIL